MNSLIQFPAQWQKHLCQRYVAVKWADNDVEKGSVRFFLAAITSLKCSETFSLGDWIGPGLEQILIYAQHWIVLLKVYVQDEE